MNLPPDFHYCDACRRTYRSTTAPESCLICGARSKGARAVSRKAKAVEISDKFQLAAEWAKGNFGK